MADIFQRMAGVTTRLLRDPATGGLGSGTIAILRQTPGAAPANEWDPPSAPAVTVLPLRAQAFGIHADLIGQEVAPGVALKMGDKTVIAAPFTGGYQPGDVLTIDGKPVTILSVENIVGAGTVSAIKFMVRG